MRYRLLFLLIAAALAFGVWAMWIADNGQGLFARRSPPPGHARLLAKLAEPTTLSAQEVRLRDLLDQIAAEHDVDIRLDDSVLTDPGLRANLPITVDARGVSLASAIRIALRKASTWLCLEVAGESLLVTHAASVGSHPENYIGRVYPLASLMPAQDRIDTEGLSDLITGAMAPTSWSDAGGLAEIEALPGGLAVAHTLEVHLQIEELLTQLSRRVENPDDLRPVDLSQAMRPGNSRAAAALERPITVEWIDVPLKDLCTRLSTILDVPVLFDAAAIDPHVSYRELGDYQAVPPFDDLSVTLVADGQPLADVLGSLRNIDLGPSAPLAMAAVWDEAIWITAGAAAPNSLRIYPVADLPPDTPDRWRVTFLRPYPRYDGLCDLITTSVAPKTWINGGGDGFIAALGDALVVSQGRHEHGDIERLIGQLRDALAPTGRGELRYALPAKRKVEAALAEKTSFHAYLLPLADAAVQLGQEHGIKILIDERAMADIGETSQMPVTFRAENTSLEQTLYRMLKPHGLTFVVLKHFLLITTNERTEVPRDRRFYDVRHLVDPDVGIADADQLTDYVTTFASSTTWWDGGGFGSIEYFSGILVVDQQRDVHQEVAALLDALTYYQQCPESLAPIPVTPAQHAGVDQLAEALQQTVSFEHCQVRLDRVAADLSERFAVPMVVEGRGSDSLVNVNVRNVSLAAALDLTLRNAEPRFVLRYGQVVISGPSWDRNDALVRLYPVRDLLYSPAAPPDPPPGPDFPVPHVNGTSQATVDYDSLVATLIEAVQLPTWQDDGIESDVDYCEGALIFSTTWQVHRRIERLLGQMRHALWPDRHPAPEPLPVDRVLQRRATLDADGAPLSEFLADQARQQEIVVQYTRPKPFVQTTLGELIWVPAPSPPTYLGGDPFGGDDPDYIRLDNYLLYLWRRYEQDWVVSGHDRVAAESVGVNEVIASLRPLDLWALRGLSLITDRWQFELRPDEPTVRCQFKDVLLGDAFHKILAPFRQVLCSDGEVVHVYPASDHSRPLITRVYDVRRLAPPVSSKPTERYLGPRSIVTGPIPVVGDPDAQLPPASPVDVIWESDLPAQGGGDFEYFVVKHLSEQTRRLASDDGAVMMYQGLLVVRHDWHVHREMAAFLAELSEATRDFPPAGQLIKEKGPDGLDRLIEAMPLAQDDRVLAYFVYLFQNVEPPQRRRQAIDRWKNADDPETREVAVKLERMTRLDRLESAASTEEAAQ